MRAVILNCPVVLFNSVHASSHWVKGTNISVVLSVSTEWSGSIRNVIVEVSWDTFTVDEDEDEDEDEDAKEKL